MSIETMILVIYTGLVRGAIPTTSQDSMSYSRKKKFTQEFFGVRNSGFLNSRSYSRFFYGKNIGSRIMFWFSPSLPTLMFYYIFMISKIPKKPCYERTSRDIKCDSELNKEEKLSEFNNAELLSQIPRLPVN